MSAKIGSGLLTLTLDVTAKLNSREKMVGLLRSALEVASGRAGEAHDWKYREYKCTCHACATVDLLVAALELY